MNHQTTKENLEDLASHLTNLRDCSHGSQIGKCFAALLEAEIEIQRLEKELENCYEIINNITYHGDGEYSGMGFD